MSIHRGYIGVKAVDVGGSETDARKGKPVCRAAGRSDEAHASMPRRWSRSAGALMAASDGVGRGAVFTLELPIAGR